jgi:type I pantothenate kinase
VTKDPNLRPPEVAAEAIADQVVSARGMSDRPLIVGIGGPVSVGKSTFAETVRIALANRELAVDVLCTDCFLLPNTELARRNLSMRKGFPGTYDNDALLAAVRAVRAGGTARVPVHSHSTYDTVAGEHRAIGPTDVLVAEGINVLQSPVVEVVDLPIYLEAHEAELRSWFVDRFAGLCATAGVGDFYAQFTSMTPEQRLTVADAAWTSINAVNNRDHILPSKANARMVIQKNKDHWIRSIAVLPSRLGRSGLAR